MVSETKSDMEPASGVHFELHGPDDGEPLFLGFPIMASHGEIFGAAAASVKAAFLGGLVDRYRVLLVDYPSIGRSRDIPPSALTADRVCADLLAVADHVSFERFAWWGYSWGAAVGLQLADRSERLSALVMGGWPPLGAEYETILRGAESQVDDPPPEVQVVLRSPAQYAQWVTFYRSLRGWDEAASVSRIACPRLAYVGGEGDVGAGDERLHNATIMRAREAELRALGWAVAFIEGRGHDVGLDAAAVLPIVRPFLDRVLGRKDA